MVHFTLLTPNLLDFFLSPSSCQVVDRDSQEDIEQNI